MTCDAALQQASAKELKVKQAATKLEKKKVCSNHVVWEYLFALRLSEPAADGDGGRPLI